MTQEEKAKAYDRALEIAKKIHSGEGVPAPPNMSVLEVVFPELVENDDEKIRKELIHQFTTLGQSWDKWGGLKIKDILAWLEKQSKQKPNKCMYSEYNYTDEDRKVLCDGCEEECELKQNPEWSEKDDKIKDLIIKASDDGCLYGYVDSEHLLDWLNSIKDRVIPQPKQEWSEEDDIMVESIRNSFGLHCGQMTEALRERYDKFFNKVKSLRPQKHWKPSDKQMEAVRIAAEIGTANNSWAMGILKSMFQDLKKLREE
jgi:hypothetical protein